MFVYGGWPFIHNELHLETPLRVERLQILDIRHETWKTVQLEKWNPADPAPFPRFHTRKTKLILIRDGLLLITGELIPQDYGSSVLLQYDVTNPLNDTWRWKSIPTIGRWWGRKFLQMEVRGEAVFRLNPECSMPNIEFHQIADVRNEKMIRLVSLGRLRSECAPLVRATFAEEYDAVQSGYRDFARQLKCHLEMEYKRRIDTSSNDTCAIFKYLNLVCKIGGCFVRGKTPSTPTTSSHANSQRFHIHVRSIPRRGQNDEPKMPRFDDVDLWELRCTIRAVLNQLHSKYYNTSRMDYLAPRVPMRNSALKRLSVYVAEVPCHVEFEEFDELRWTPQAEQYPSPVDTDGYFLVGSHHDVIMHSGRVRYPGTLEKMGQTILLTPIAEK
ncbi:DUF295 domain-containing protein [Caenorhabditis elegans]|nr:DUF295 domain-containing protein [Caenorhabditis elegans]CAD1857023.1 DUF295 domain-containing protein [Caenorhabditis elegans]